MPVTKPSLPSRERELKLYLQAKPPPMYLVAPFTGARVETMIFGKSAVGFGWSLPSRERELKPIRAVKFSLCVLSLPSRERELKQTAIAERNIDIAGRSLHGSAS